MKKIILSIIVLASSLTVSFAQEKEFYTEKACHDIMCKPYHVISHYNGYADRGVTVDVPMIELTTLDKNKDQQTSIVSNNNGKNEDSNQQG